VGLILKFTFLHLNTTIIAFLTSKLHPVEGQVVTSSVCRVTNYRCVELSHCMTVRFAYKYKT
jgi:hypothetical protein